MPRPKRSRVASSQAATTRQAQTSAALEADRPPLATKSNMPNSSAPAGTSSDGVEINDGENLRGRKKRATAGDPLGQNNTAPGQTRNLRGDAMSRLDTSVALASDDASDRASPPVERGRRQSSLAARRTRRATDASGLELDDDLFAALDDELDDGEDNDDTEARTGHYSTDTSSFNVALFKRRPRQSSVARDVSIRPSSRGGAATPLSSTFSFSTFRRRAREPSILGATQKERSYRRAASSQASEASVDGEALAPDAAGTPLTTYRQGSKTPSGLDSSREPSPVALARKRKSEGEHVGEKRRSIENDEVRPSIESESSPLSSARECATPERTAAADEEDPDLAPPLSSGSSDGSPILWPSLDNLAQRANPPRRAALARARRTPDLEDDDMSDMSSPPSLTHSPTGAASRTRSRQRPAVVNVSPRWSTKDLASLLPKRRRRARSENPFDLRGSDDEVDTRGLDNDEDELTYIDTGAVRKRVARGRAVAPSGPTRRTYGRFAQEDEEDEEDEVDEGAQTDREGGAQNRTATPKRISEPSEELIKAAAKFKEVDKWDLSFEEVAEDPSPVKDAR